MTQWIITGIILLVAVLFAIRRLVLLMRKKKPLSNNCNPMEGDCANCLKKSRQNNGYNTNHDES
ncbi:MAG: FeoB-associated Cys-rich membrane protein [Bacteroidota bacterium]